MFATARRTTAHSTQSTAHSTTAHSATAQQHSSTAAQQNNRTTEQQHADTQHTAHAAHSTRIQHTATQKHTSTQHAARSTDNGGTSHTAHGTQHMARRTHSTHSMQRRQWRHIRHIRHTRHAQHTQWHTCSLTKFEHMNGRIRGDRSVRSQSVSPLALSQCRPPSACTRAGEISVCLHLQLQLPLRLLGLPPQEQPPPGWRLCRLPGWRPFLPSQHLSPGRVDQSAALLKVGTPPGARTAQGSTSCF